jgi:dienelactone hydrolase
VIQGRGQKLRALCAAAFLLTLSGETHPEPPPDPGLEDAARQGSMEAFLAKARSTAQAAPTSLDALEAALVPTLRFYKPDGPGPFPTTLFLHGCSGPTLSHEEDWGRFHSERGAAMIAVDSLAPRKLEGQPVCDLQALTGRERAADVLASLAHARDLPFVDREHLALMGFSHGAWTIWELFVLASHSRPPLGLAEWPASGLRGVRAAFLFYGPCLEAWTVDVPTMAFLAGEDRYIDAQACIEYAEGQAPGPSESPRFSYRLFEGATHTFDHARPSAVNRDAGSIYDPRATRAAQAEIERAMKTLLQAGGQPLGTAPQ